MAKQGHVMTQKRILIYLYTDSASWLILDETGQVQQLVLHGNLADLSSQTSGHKIEVIVPGQSILLTSAELPKLSSQRVKQALPFALEEQLIDDVADLHFAIGEYQPDQHFPVAVIAKETMDTYLATLTNANIIPHTLIPATLALPYTADNAYICIDNDIAVVRLGPYSGFACDKENLSTLLALQLSGLEQKISFIHIYNFTTTPIALNLEGITLNEVTFIEDEFLKHLAKWTAAYPSINLLQGSYQTTKASAPTKKIWIAAMCVALAWVGFSFLSNLGSYFILHHAASLSELQINKIYKRNFPQSASVVAPRQRMEEKLKKLSLGNTKNTFLTMLAVVGDKLTTTKGIQLVSLDYRGNQLTLSVTATSFDSLDGFAQALTHQHLTVKQQNASIAGTSVKANLQITQGVL